MEKLIKDSLLTDKTIIIPTLGTLTLTNSDTMEIMFLPYLKFDDKKLTSNYAEINNCSYTEAKELVYNWVENLIAKVTAGQSQAILDLGSFYLNSEKEIDFSSDNDIPTSKEDAKEQIEHTTIEDIQKEEPILEPAILIDTPTEIIEEVVADFNINTATMSIEDTDKEEPINEPITYSEIASETIESNIHEEKAPVENIQEEIKKEKSEELPNEEHAKKRSKAPVILFSFIGLLLIAGISFYFFSDTFKTNSNKIPSSTSSVEQENVEAQSESMNESEEETTVQSEEPIGEEQPVVEENITQDKSSLAETINTPQSNSANESERYYVIVGSFEEQANAERLLSDLKSKQYNSEIIISGSFKMVALTYFSTLSEAQSKVNEIGNAWILKK